MLAVAAVLLLLVAAALTNHRMSNWPYALALVLIAVAAVAARPPPAELTGALRAPPAAGLLGGRGRAVSARSAETGRPALPRRSPCPSPAAP
ncbi:hypothetical protein GL263_14715 [Streptomyces durbertensis]|uniref:Uncharacterized protein n=1 Tax=Streptomyces durbertensis TaxID=2448886 RepID=A0ABR6EHK0_9ACTN|nr:hypothetical protein [Streptomyces durbertensis]MBB1244809.1 hypothetical protein [Streptomyces durbertensis]